MFLDLVQLSSSEIRLQAGGGRARVLLSASYVVIGILCIVYAYSHQAPFLRVAGIGVLTLGGLVAWLGALKRYRVIADTPTATLRSAAQGYVELIGICAALAGAELLCFGKAPPCLWYRATITEHRRGFGKNDTRTHVERSDECFLIEDRTGECVVDPEHAEVLSAHTTRWRNGDMHYKVNYLLPGDPIYAIGVLETLRPADGVLDARADVSALLREWKRNRAELVRRFDTNRDGDIDLQEWQGAVTTAEREVHARHDALRLEPGVHLMRAPRDGRPFLLSNRDPDELTRRYRWWAWLHLAVFVAASVWGMTLLLGAPR
ncbi:MAG: hypothetical protein R3286_07925 [Gammaproteobacteria bacterium]|nr:hypothetical protein [Gammaproteobacteria bacterium]